MTGKFITLEGQEGKKEDKKEDKKEGKREKKKGKNWLRLILL